MTTGHRAAAALLDGRIRVLKRTDDGLTLECQSSTRGTSRSVLGVRGASRTP